MYRKVDSCYTGWRIAHFFEIGRIRGYRRTNDILVILMAPIGGMEKGVIGLARPPCQERIPLPHFGERRKGEGETGGIYPVQPKRQVSMSFLRP